MSVCVHVQMPSSRGAGEKSAGSAGDTDNSLVQPPVWNADSLLVCIQTPSTQDAEDEEPSSTGDSGSSAVQPLVRDADNVLSCLKRALKIANAAQQQLAVALKASDTSPAFLYVEILNQYLYYFERGLPNITASVIQVNVYSADST